MAENNTQNTGANPQVVPQSTPQAPAADQKQFFSLSAAPDKTNETPQKSAISFLKDLMKRESREAPDAGKSPSQSQDTGNVFTELFGKSKELPAAPGQSNGAKAVTSSPPVLMVSPKMSILRQQAQRMHEQKTVSIFKIIFIALALTAAAGFGYLYIQLNPDFTLFGKTIAKEFAESTEKAKALQTKKNEFRLRTAAIYLAKVNILSDSFLENFAKANSTDSSVGEKLAADAALGEARESLKQYLDVIAENLKEPLAISLPGVEVSDQMEYEKGFEEALKQSFISQKESARTPSELRMLENLTALTADRSLRGYLKNIKPDSLDDKKIKEIIDRVHDEWTDDLSLISQLKEKRIRWSEVINQLDSVTRKVDKLYSQGLFDEIGGIQYSSYEFNADTKTVSVSGMVKTEDTKTFTMMVDLVSALEKSPHFKNVEMRDFAKARAGEDSGFSGSIRLTFNLQDSDEKDPRDSEIPVNITP